MFIFSNVCLLFSKVNRAIFRFSHIKRTLKQSHKVISMSQYLRYWYSFVNIYLSKFYWPLYLRWTKRNSLALWRLWLVRNGLDLFFEKWHWEWFTSEQGLFLLLQFRRMFRILLYLQFMVFWRVWCSFIFKRTTLKCERHQSLTNREVIDSWMC